MKTSKKLDPRLRRLIAASATTVSMEGAVEHGELIPMGSSRTASSLNKRVLIEVNDTISADQAAESDWTHVSGNIYTASITLDRLEKLATEIAKVRTELFNSFFFPENEDKQRHCCLIMLLLPGFLFVQSLASNLRVVPFFL